MRIEEISNLEAVAFIAGVMVFALVLFRLIPAADAEPRRKRAYSRRDITRYDRAIPKHLIAAAIALALAGVHATIKSFPPVYLWIAEAGYGGHLVRDIANSHLAIVIGGTVAATGLTWYALPRVANRPLWSEGLATASFWCTVLGASGFYVANLVTGLVLGVMTHHGASAPDLGLWRAVPIGLSATIMGVGYWTFVLDVVMTAWLSRSTLVPGPDRHLIKFFVIGALGLFAGTVQGVIQVMPTPEHWIKSTGAAGDYIDPIAHAHVNLVTGLLMLAAGIAFTWSRAVRRTAARRRLENAIFWVLAPASVAFYGTFLFLGWSEGSAMLRDGLTFSEAVDHMGWRHTLPLSLAGTATLAGVWFLLGTLAWRFLRGPERTLPGAWIVGGASILLVVGTGQGLIQLVPGVKAWLHDAGEPGDAIVNAHAQLNMLGGIIPILFVLTFMRGRPLLPASVAHLGVNRWLAVALAGMAVYWAAALATAIVQGVAVHRGLGDPAYVKTALPLGPLGMATGSGIFAAGFTMVAFRLWSVSGEYRAEGWRLFRRSLEAYEGSTPAYHEHVPRWTFPLAEAGFAFFGFPGIGWMMSGRPLIGLPLVLVSPGIAWALIPTLSSPFGNGPLAGMGGDEAILSYLLSTTILSVGSLSLWHYRHRPRRRHAPALEGTGPTA